METPKFNKFINIDDFTEESKPLIVDYTCPLCKGIYYNPVIDMCGHIFCEKCFTLHFEHKRICPVDNVPLDATPTKVRPISMILEKQILKCKNREFGCGWNGPLKEFQEHINRDCQRQTVMCSWIGCSDYVFREDLPLHDRCCEYRVIMCEYCELELPFNQLKMHQDHCPKFKLPCPQECGENVERESIDKHILESCLNTIMQCPYTKYGCSDTVIKRDLTAFLNENRIKHESMTMSLIDKLVDRIDDLEHQMNTVKKMATISEQLNNSLKTPLSQLGKRRREEEQLMEIEPMSTVKDERTTQVLTPIEEDKQEESTSSSTFDSVSLPQEIWVSGSKAKCISNLKKEHMYLFSAVDIPYEEKDSISTWTVTVIQNNNWMGLGLCDKAKVLKNKKKFYSSSKKSFNTGTFIISLNGYTWNCNVEEENNLIVQELIVTEQKEVIFSYDPKANELTYRIDTLSGKLTEVYPIVGVTLTPCVVFFDVGGFIDMGGISTQSAIISEDAE